PTPQQSPRPGKAEETAPQITDAPAPLPPNPPPPIPAPAGRGGGPQMVRVGGTLPPAPAGNFYMLRSYHSSAHEIWNVTDPGNPKPLLTVKTSNPLIGDQTGGANRTASTHKNWWECDKGIAYMGGPPRTDPAAGRNTGGN